MAKTTLTPTEIKAQVKGLKEMLKQQRAELKPLQDAVKEATKAEAAAKKEADKAVAVAQKSAAAAAAKDNYDVQYSSDPDATTQAQLNAIFEQRSYDAPESRARLARFRERFCAFDDGQAARRVITTVMVP